SPLIHLSKDFSKLYNNPQDANILFKVGPDKAAVFYGHTLILQCRSAYFEKALSDEWKERQTTTDDGKYTVFEKPNISKDVFALLLRFIYTGVVDLIEQKKKALCDSEARARRRNRKKQHRTASPDTTTTTAADQTDTADAATITDDDTTDHDDTEAEDPNDNAAANEIESDAAGDTGHDRHGSGTTTPLPPTWDVGGAPVLDYDGEATLLLDLLVASDELLVTDLTDILQHHLTMFYSQHIDTHALRVLRVADQHSWPLLKHYCMDVICKDPYPVFFSDQLASIDEALLVEVLKCDELRMKEIDVWECVVAWGLLQVGKMGGGLGAIGDGEEDEEEEDDDQDDEEDENTEEEEERKERNGCQMRLHDEKWEVDTGKYEEEGDDNRHDVIASKIIYFPAMTHRKMGKQPFLLHPPANPLLSTSTMPAIPFNFSHKPLVLWTRGDFRLLHQALLPLLPHIRLFQISGPDFLDRVDPYRCVPEPIRAQLLHYYIKGHSYRPTIPRSLSPPYRVLPPRQTHSFSSVLITDKHRLMIDNWIRGHDDILYTFSPFPPPPPQPLPSTSSQLSSSSTTAATTTPPVTTSSATTPPTTRTVKKFIWTLLYRATRDGFDARDFHRHCDNLGATVSIVRVKGTGEIVGGYNPESWQSVVGGRYKTARGSFLFTITGGVKALRTGQSRRRSRGDAAGGPRRSTMGPVGTAGAGGAGGDGNSTMRRAMTLAGGENLDRLRWRAVVTDSDAEEDGDDNDIVVMDEDEDDPNTLPGALTGAAAHFANNDPAAAAGPSVAPDDTLAFDPSVYHDPDYPYASTTQRHRLSSLASASEGGQDFAVEELEVWGVKVLER
ncbi:hypothetical protein BC936DRAFT_141900, partial [Jimgerdemannia flammicorona]